MRRARLTWKGAFHHLMNRGIEGSNIFFDDQLKEAYLHYLGEAVKRYRIRLFSYCVMDNHYHLVLENSSGRLSDLMRQLNGRYGQYYRNRLDSTGYVFQGRYKSTIIQDENYLMQCVAYVLQNPLKASLCKHVHGYVWSSINSYFSNSQHPWVDSGFIEDIFRSRENLLMMVEKIGDYELKVRNTSWGGILGGEDFLEKAIKHYDRREEKDSLERKRYDDFHFEPVEKVISEFENKIGQKMTDIDFGTWKGKRLRGKLLVRLKDLSGLKYSEIAKLDMFSDLRSDSLKSIYINSKKKKLISLYLK